MKRKSSIVKLSLIGVAIVLGFVLAFCPIKIGFTTYKGFANTIKLGLDLKGGVYAVYEAESQPGSNEDFDSAMDGTIASLNQVLSGKGYTEAALQREGNSKIRVSVPAVDNPKEILKILGSPAEIVFRMTDTGKDVLNGQHVTKATASFVDGQDVVALSLTSAGASLFAKATGDNINSTMDIVMISGGEETIISSPTIQSAITGGQAVITGMTSPEQAQKLAQQITAGKFSLTLTQKEVSTVSATLGENALLYGLIAGAIGMIIIIAFMVFLYRMFGVASGMAMLIYTVLMLFILSVFPWVQLTLPGIAGILLSIGMAIDGNIIISERIRDEYRAGKSILSASHYGYRKSVSAILDGNITTILASIVLLIFGTGSVQGFAITLIIGIVLAMFSSLVVTRLLIKYVVRINNTDPKLFNLVRGEGYENLSADKNDALTEMELDEISRKKAEKKAQRTPEGGVV